MRTWTTSALGLCIATLAMSACNTADKGSLSITDKVALVQAVNAGGAFNDMGAAAPFAPIAITLLGSTGTLTAGAAPAGAPRNGAFDIMGVQAANYDGAMGVQVIFQVHTASSNDTGSFTGVVGWTNLNSSANTVDELVSAGVLTSGSTTPIGAGVSTPIGGTATSPARAGYARYTNNTTASSYIGTSGTFVLSSSTFTGAGTDCSQTYEGHQVTCSYVVGTMSGNFAFSANRVTGGGTTPYSQSTVTFANLPSIQLTITVNN